MRKLVLVLVLVLVGGAEAQTPFIFEAGTPAKASEVNSNFADIDQQITTIGTSVANSSVSTDKNTKDIIDVNKRLLSLETATKCNTPSQANQIAFNYDKKIGVLGQQFNLAQSGFVLIKAPFVTIENGDRYAITYPHPRQSITPLTTTWGEDHLSFCGQGTIAGYPARAVTLTFKRTIIFTPPNIFSRLESVVSQRIEILVGQTVVSFMVFALSNELPGQSGVATPFDYTNYANVYGVMQQPYEAIYRQLDDMIDYIDIVKLP